MGEGRVEGSTLFVLGTSAAFSAGPCLEACLKGAFLLGPGLEEGVFRDFGGCGGLDSVEPCSLSTTGEACLEGAFLLESGLEEGVFRDFGGCGGPDSVEACSLSTTGEAYLGVAVSYPFVGEPSGEDTNFSITGGCYLEALVFLGRP